MADATIRADYVALYANVTAYAAPHEPVVRLLRVFNAEAVNGVVTVDSIAPSPDPAVTPNGFRLTDFTDFGLWVKCAGASPSITVRLLESYNDTSGNYVVPETGGTLITVADTSAHVVSVTPTKMPWARLRLVGGATNGTDTTVTAYLMKSGEA